MNIPLSIMFDDIDLEMIERLLYGATALASAIHGNPSFGWKESDPGDIQQNAVGTRHRMRAILTHVEFSTMTISLRINQARTLLISLYIERNNGDYFLAITPENLALDDIRIRDFLKALAASEELRGSVIIRPVETRIGVEVSSKGTPYASLASSLCGTFQQVLFLYDRWLEAWRSGRLGPGPEY